MAGFCAGCGTQLADNAGFCPSCGARVGQGVGGGTAAAPATTPSTEGMTDNVAGMVAYITFIPAILFLVMEPYNRKPFVRFHSFQCLFFSAAWTVLWIGLSIISGILPFLAFAMLVLFPVIGLAGTVLWVFLLIKAYQGQWFKLPVIGDMAEKQANSVR